MLVKELMATKVVTVNENDTYEEAVRKLVNNKITGAPVLNDAGDLIGIIAESDLSRVLYPSYDHFCESPSVYADFEEREKKVKEIRDHNIKQFIVKNVHTISPDDPIMKAGGIMLAKDIDRMPVLEEGKLVGVIGRRKLFRHIFKENLNF